MDYHTVVVYRKQLYSCISTLSTCKILCTSSRRTNDLDDKESMKTSFIVNPYFDQVVDVNLVGGDVVDDGAGGVGADGLELEGGFTDLGAVKGDDREGGELGADSGRGGFGEVWFWEQALLSLLPLELLAFVLSSSTHCNY
ncbi:hypothetical protein L1987_02547 [Smallanthus sonchifolius]|uniref:Uncharacterized protein n=1 Tax=Smallanthus sonchifolius TaxID=185202 RepID=A0ACB9K897_9ASTR|nr:hypothetical protein L1987_02547 [Smallanthus sonchifolius]